MAVDHDMRRLHCVGAALLEGASPTAMLQHYCWPGCDRSHAGTAHPVEPLLPLAVHNLCYDCDAKHAPALQYCLPTDAPHLAQTSRALAAALSPMVWARHKPDRFDSFSAGAPWASIMFDDAALRLLQCLALQATLQRVVRYFQSCMEQ